MIRLLFLLAIFGLTRCDEPPSGFDIVYNHPHLQPNSEQDDYWSWGDDDPVLLLGASDHPYPYLADNWREDLDRLHKTGGNYVRFAVAAGVDSVHNPFTKHYRGSPEKYYRLAEEYWMSLYRYVHYAAEHSVVVEIDIWDHVAFNRDGRDDIFWTHFKPGSELLDSTFLPGEHPFFETVPGAAGYQEKYRLLWEYQRLFVNELLNWTYYMPNVIYNVEVPSNLQIPWMVYWGKYIEDFVAKKNAEELNKHRTPYRVNVRLGVAQARPINLAAFNERLLRGAGTAFHRPRPYGNGASSLALNSIRGARVVERHLRFWELRPAPELLLEENSPSTAATDGKGNYLVYLPRAGGVNLAPDWPGQPRVTVTVVGHLGTQRSEVLEPPYGDSFRLYTEDEKGGWMILEPEEADF